MMMPFDTVQYELHREMYLERDTLATVLSAWVSWREDDNDKVLPFNRITLGYGRKGTLKANFVNRLKAYWDEIVIANARRLYGDSVIIHDRVNRDKT